MAIKAFNLTAPLLPLLAYEQEDCFKLYMSDIGLLAALYGYSTKAAVVNETISGSVKGALYENLIAGALVRRGYPLRYLRDKREPLEVEFLIERDGLVVPVEVKASNAATASLDRVLARDDISFISAAKTCWRCLTNSATSARHRFTFACIYTLLQTGNITSNFQNIVLNHNSTMLSLPSPPGLASLR